MCFDLTIRDTIKYRKGTLRPKKAKEDIIVYKNINIDGSGLHFDLKDKNGNFMAWVPGYQYTELGRTQFFGLNYDWVDSIYGGMLHSSRFPGMNRKKFIIPKGTNYYENYGEYVSKSLIYPHQNEI